MNNPVDLKLFSIIAVGGSVSADDHLCHHCRCFQYEREPAGRRSILGGVAPEAAGLPFSSRLWYHYHYSHCHWAKERFSKAPAEQVCALLSGPLSRHTDGSDTKWGLRGTCTEGLRVTTRR